MKKYYKGLRSFKESCFKKEEDFFRRLSKGQSPEALFITCVDSRIDPNLLTQSMPGELLMLRTPGNIIPPYSEIKCKSSIAATIEFAVADIRVKNIIICGHSGCVAMHLLNQKEDVLSDLPLLREWLKLSASVSTVIKERHPDMTDELRQSITEKENLLCQLHNIQTYPFVKKAINAGKLNLYGWYYDIGTGNVFEYKPSSGSFEQIV